MLFVILCNILQHSTASLCLNCLTGFMTLYPLCISTHHSSLTTIPSMHYVNTSLGIQEAYKYRWLPSSDTSYFASKFCQANISSRLLSHIRPKVLVVFPINPPTFKIHHQMEVFLVFLVFRLDNLPLDNIVVSL